MEPGFGHAPFPLHGGGRRPKNFGRFFHGESSEEAQFDYAALRGVERPEPREGFVDFVEVDFFRIGQADCFVEREFSRFASTLCGVGATGVIDQDAAHQLRRDAEEVRSTLPVNSCLVNKLHVCFVDQGGGLEGVAGALAAHVACREFP